MKRYRYITTGIASPSDKLSTFRLVGGNQLYGNLDAIRVTIPEDVELIKYDCDNYSTTECAYFLKDLNPKVMIRINGRFRENAELTSKWLYQELAPHQFHDYMESLGYYIYLRFGYITGDMFKFCSDHHDKLWQLERIPKSNDFAGFYTDEEYRDKFPDVIAYMREFVDKDVIPYIRKFVSDDTEYEKLKSKVRSLSDVRLVDIYAETCFANRCDTRLTRDFDDYIKHAVSERLQAELWY